MKISLLVTGFLFLMSGTGVVDSGGKLSTMVVQVLVGIVLVGMAVLIEHYELKDEKRVSHSNEYDGDVVEILD